MVCFELSKVPQSERSYIQQDRPRKLPQAPPPNRYLYEQVTEADEFLHKLTQARKKRNQKLLRADGDSTV